MRVLIVEDEQPAIDKLQKSIGSMPFDVQVTGVCHSIKETVEHLRLQAGNDVILMDIELSDGSSFEIFREISITCPVIFITAYDNYWQKAFEYNSIDYLLKPVRNEKLEGALRKYLDLKNHFEFNYKSLLEERATKKTLLVKKGSEFIALKLDDVAYFHGVQRLVIAVTHTGKKLIVDYTLAELDELLDETFYRLNRQYIASRSSIIKITALPKSKLAIDLRPTISSEVVVSQESASGFKQWLRRATVV
jgi:DNA-binding LytR/AlgR family response regulator